MYHIIIVYECACAYMCMHNAYICLLLLYRLYNKMTMEVILSTAFGRAIDVQGGNGGKLYKAALETFAALTPSADNQMTFTRILQFLICEPACCITVHDCM